MKLKSTNKLKYSEYGIQKKKKKSYKKETTLQLEIFFSRNMLKTLHFLKTIKKKPRLLNKINVIIFSKI